MVFELPNIDIIGLLGKLFIFIQNNLVKLISWIFNLVGGNPIIAAIVISFPIYLLMDFIYHRMLDKPTANLGNSFMRVARNMILFSIIFFIGYSIWKGG